MMIRKGLQLIVNPAILTPSVAIWQPEKSNYLLQELLDSRESIDNWVHSEKVRMFCLLGQIVQTPRFFTWPPESLWEAALASVIFGLIGIGLAIFGFKLFDWLTPGSFQEEVLQKNNIAAAILAGAFLIGISLIVAA